MSLIPFGPFDASAPLGRGGMGEVWAGVHRKTGTAVAIKVMTAESFKSEVFERAFEAEVRAVASLDHPGIIRLYDVGVVGESTAAESGARIAAGCPYLVMEMARSGNLSSQPPARDWPTIRRLLHEILAALGHAHARGVIHRDIKPENVLWGSSADGRPRAILSDFGIAHAGDEGGREGPTWGTPAYMAPERFTLEWRDLGPWTDLYSVGCLAFALLRGVPPFKGSPLAQAMQAHLYRPVPALRAEIPVPAGLDTWLRTLLAKVPEERFQGAADAAWALDELGEAQDGAGPPLPASDPDTQPTRQTSSSRGGNAWGEAGPSSVDPGPLPRGEEQTVGTAEITWTDDTFDPAALSRGSPQARRAPRKARQRYALPDMPADWRPAPDQGHADTLPGGGLRLFGLRVVRMVDREVERDALWEALGRARRRGRPEAVLLRGQVGTGKTRLAEWLSERAAELGAAIPLRADHGPGGGPTPLARMVARQLRVLGLGPRTLRGRVQAWLQSHEVRDEWFTREMVALASLGAGLPLEPEEAPRDLRGTVRRFLALLSRGRPLVLHLDDIPWGATSMGFVVELLEQAPRLPVLLLMTARDEELAQQPVATSTLADLHSRGLMTALLVEDLPPGHRRDLVRQLLGVEDELAARVAERTGGNPLFTVALVRDWVARGVLEEGPGGLALAPGTTLELPDDIHDVWHSRLERVLGAISPPARPALEVAAALGEAVDGEEWASACAQAGVPWPEALFEGLAEDRLLTGTPGSWRFSHGMVRESVVRVAREAGRWSEVQAACARMLELHHKKPSSLVHERIGRHLVEAGEGLGALPHLEAGVRGRMSQGDPAAGLVVLSAMEGVLAGLADWAAPLERVRVDLLRARLMVDLGRLRDAAHWARRAGASAETLGRSVGEWRLLRAHALLLQGHVDILSGQVGDAERTLAEARRLFGLDAAFEDLAECQRLTGRLRRATGDLDGAEEALSEAAELFGALQWDAEWADCLVSLAQVAIDRGDSEHATGLLTSAIERYRGEHHPRGEADCLRIGAEAARLRGDTEAAEARYRRAQAIYQRIGSAQALDCRLGRARLALERGDLEEAGRLVGNVRGEAATYMDLRVRATALALLIAARAADWEAFELAFGDLARLLLNSGMKLAEVRDLVGAAAREAAVHGEVARAARVRGSLGS